MMRLLEFAVVLIASSMAVCLAQTSSSSDEGTSLDDTVQLRQDVISANDHRFRPLEDQSKPIKVLVTFYLLSLLSIDELKQKVELNLWINFTWRDELRTWDPDSYGGIDVMHPDPKDIWRPRVFVSNSLQDRDVFVDKYAPLSLYWDGMTRWYPGSIFYTSCAMDLKYFPYDEHECSLIIYTNDFPAELVLKPVRPNVRLNGYWPNGEWTLIDTTVKSFIAKIGEENSTRVSMTLKLKRKPQSFVANILIPVCVLSLLSIMVFILPRESGERASYSITVLLSMAVFLSIVSADLPKHPDSFPLIVTYLLCLLILGGLSVVATVCVLAWHGSAKSSVLEGSADPQRNKGASDNGMDGHVIRKSVAEPHSTKHLKSAGSLNNLALMLQDMENTYSIATKGNQIDPLTTDFKDSLAFPSKPKAVDNSGSKTRKFSTKIRAILGKWLKNIDAVLFVLFLSAWCVISVYFFLAFNLKL